MEALTAASVAALTVYDMAKAVDRDMSITDVSLVEKTKEPTPEPHSGPPPRRNGEGGCADGLRRRLTAPARIAGRRCSQGCWRRRASTSSAASCQTSGGDRRRDRDLAATSSLVLTTGGTGFRRATSPPRRRGRCSTARRREWRRRSGRTRHEDPARAALRGVAGLRGATLVVNLPGSPGGCRDGFAVLRPALVHGLELAAGDRPRRTPRHEPQARPRLTGTEAPAADPPLPRRFASLVKFEHTIFALPFAYVGAFLAVGGYPGTRDLVWITVAMVGPARSQWGSIGSIDAELDARNPRTAGREIPAGILSRRQVWGLCALALVLYLGAVFQLDPIVRWLWPIPVAMFVVYPYLKRVTWLCHLWLGACTGLAPVGAWLAVTGSAPWEAWALFAAQGPLGRRLRPVLLALRPRARPRGRLELVGARFGERGVFAGARIFHVDRGRPARRRRRRARGRRLLLARPAAVVALLV